MAAGSCFRSSADSFLSSRISCFNPLPPCWGTFQLPARETGEESGVESSSTGVEFKAGCEVSMKALTGAALRVLCGKCVGTMVALGAAAGLEEGVGPVGDTIVSMALDIVGRWPLVVYGRWQGM